MVFDLPVNTRGNSKCKAKVKVFRVGWKIHKKGHDKGVISLSLVII